jgi:hypothetical protein
MPRRDRKLQAYLELLRLPNVFTAIADVLMGAFVAVALAPHSPATGVPVGIVSLLICTSSCLYLAGMVWNDYFDRDKDAEQRPARPIPSRRVPESAAQWLGSQLIVVGLVAAFTAAYFVGWRSGILALALAAAVLSYDGLLKETWLGPINMGLCRMLNVLLGMCVIADPWHQTHYLVAAGIGIYIVGVTGFARTEAVVSNRFMLLAGVLVMLAGLGTLAYFPNLVPKSYVSGRLETWTLFWIVLAAQISWRCLRAVADPRPPMVQTAVKTCLLSLIVLDAAITYAVQGWQGAILILGLLIPTMFLGKWIYST